MSGGKELALELEAKGYEWVEAARRQGPGVSEAVSCRTSSFAPAPAIADGPELAGAGPPGRGRPLRARSGFPTPRDEEWRFTPVAPIAQGTWRPAPGVPATVTRRPAHAVPLRAPGVDHAGLRERRATARRCRAVADAARAVSGSAAWPRRCAATAACSRRTSRRHAPVDGSPFTALNTAALPRRRRCVHVPAGLDLERPVHFVFVTTAGRRGHRDPPAQPDRGRAGSPRVGHRELRHARPGTASTAPIR